GKPARMERHRRRLRDIGLQGREREILEVERQRRTRRLQTEVAAHAQEAAAVDSDLGVELWPVAARGAPVVDRHGDRAEPHAGRRRSRAVLPGERGLLEREDVGVNRPWRTRLLRWFFR